MTTTGTFPKIGFPVPLLGERPCRLDVLHNDTELFALNKPAGPISAPHDWYPGCPSLMEAIDQQILAGKPELKRLGIDEARPVFGLEGEVSGVVLYAKSAEASEFYRNQYGSMDMSLAFHLVARRQPEEESFECDLPLARHFTKPRLVVSHKTGKRAGTAFRLLSRIGGYALWEARTEYHRAHQVRIHAAECGLGIVGESIYGHEPPVLLSRLKPGYRPSTKRKERPLYDGLCLHLHSVGWTDRNRATAGVEAEIPSAMAVMLKKLDAYSGARGQQW